jgi:hypothetical protein
MTPIEIDGGVLAFSRTSMRPPDFLRSDAADATLAELD